MRARDARKRLVESVEAGQTYTITQDGKPVAVILPVDVLDELRADFFELDGEQS